MKLGVCVPYRNREEHLAQFSPRVHKFLVVLATIPLLTSFLESSACRELDNCDIYVKNNDTK